MGFLDFLKKNDSKQPPNIEEVRRKVGLDRSEPQRIDPKDFMPPTAHPGLMDAPPPPNARGPPKAQKEEPVVENPSPLDEPKEELPIPPHPNEFDSIQLEAPQFDISEKDEHPPESVDDLPDFTDEELASFDEEHEVPALEVTVPDHEKEPKAEKKISEPKEQLKAPVHDALPNLKPASFLSSDEYFSIISSMRSIRKDLRDSDSYVRNSLLKHEQANEQMHKLAAATNEVQEGFMFLDEALFEH